MRKYLLQAVLGVVVVGGLDVAIRLNPAHGIDNPRPEAQSLGKLPEKIVYVRSKDDVVSAGVVFTASKNAVRHTAVIWFHGWGANFYLPSYVAIGRALAERGFTTISANTRMHDIGNVEKYSNGKRVRGGGYWGVAGEDSRDIKAWIDYAEHIGFNRVIVVGHSAGWASVGRYQADAQDPRVAGLVLASGKTGIAEVDKEADLTAKAKKLVEAGAGEELIRLPNPKFPSYVSAATLLDSNTVTPELNDFFGIKSQNAAAARIRCPLLAFFGDHDDIAGQAELDLVKRSLQRLNGGPRSFDTAIIHKADHEYNGQSEQVASTIASWARKLKD